MFELINEDLEGCLEILRLMASCETRNEQLTILWENRIDEDDIKKTIDLCEMMCYYNDKVKQKGK